MKYMGILSKKITLIVVLAFLCLIPAGKKIYGEDGDPEEWIESQEVLLDKVRYETKSRKLSVEITQSKEDIAHEYELYMFIEGELEGDMGRFLYLNNILSILGIMTVDTNDRVKVYTVGTGKIVISDQELYFGNNEAVAPGTKVLIGVEALDENYNPSKSNLIELTIGEESAEAGAINAIDKPGNTDIKSDNQSGGGPGLLLILLGATLALGAAVAGYFFLGKKKNNGSNNAVVKNRQESERKIDEKKTEDEKPEISFEDKTIFVDSDDEKLIETLKGKHYLEVLQPEEKKEGSDPDEEAAESEAHLYICKVNDEERLNELLKKKEELLKKVSLGLVVERSLFAGIREKLEQLKKDKKISGYICAGSDENDIMIKLILPILRPDIKSDASLENIGTICDLLGIPGISSIISTYISGRDIKATIEEGDLGFSGSASIISNVASIMGMDTLSSVSGLVGDIEAMRDATEEDAGANEKKNAIKGAKDIVDVVKDLTDKS
jgi:hypothetical protein